MSSADERLRKWRLILGKDADPEGEGSEGGGIPLEGRAAGMDATLEALYGGDDRKGGLGASRPNVSRWLGDIRKYFPTETVRLLQRDALERLGLKRMLLEPELLETVVPDVNLVATLLSLKNILPEKSRETARAVVRRVVEEVEKELRQPFLQTVNGRRRLRTPNRRPKPRDIDWPRTITANLKHYQPDYRTVLPVNLRGQSRSRSSMKHLILLIDQSGSMANSVVYAGILSCVLASVASLRTRVVAFDTSVVDLTDALPDPIELLFALQLGGGTHIAKALRYAEQLVVAPRDTTVVLLSDLFENESVDGMLAATRRLVDRGVTLLPLLALSDEGAPAYDHEVAARLTELGLRPFASTPGEFARVLGEVLWD